MLQLFTNHLALLAGDNFIKSIIEYISINFIYIMDGLVDSLKMMLIASVIACMLGLPLGVFLTISSKNHIMPMPKINSVLNVIVNILRSVPFLILLVAIMPFTRFVLKTGVGTRAMTFTLVIAAIPFVGRVVETTLKTVDHGVIEAAVSMGASKWQIITKVMLVESFPALLNDLTMIMITILSYSAMAGSVGAGGLGQLAISIGYHRRETEMLYIAVVLLLLLVQIIQVVGEYLAHISDHTNRY